MRYVLWAAVIAALFVALVTAVFFVPIREPEATPDGAEAAPEDEGNNEEDESMAG